jgi:hypothetical protein
MRLSLAAPAAKRWRLEPPLAPGASRQVVNIAVPPHRHGGCDSERSEGPMTTQISTPVLVFASVALMIIAAVVVG